MNAYQPILDFIQPILLFSLSDLPDITSLVTLIFVICITYALIKASSRSIKIVHSHWHHLFDTRPFTPLEFYESLKAQIDDKGIEGILYSSVTHSERGILSAKRIYLRVTFREYMIDICAAPFGKEAFFVSWWLGGNGFGFRDFLISIPFVGRLFSRREKTFYEQDTEIMFKETIAGCVKHTIEQLTETTGQRLAEMIDFKGSALQFNNR